MADMTPKVTVLMSVYNGERYLREAIDSVIGQTFADFEFLIIDDASSDGSSEIIAEYADRDPRVVIFRNNMNMGLTKSLNKGLRIAGGEYIARHDADDVSLPARLEKQVCMLEGQPDVVLVSGNLDLIDGDGHVWRQPRRRGHPLLIAWFLLFYNYLGGHSQVMFRRQPVIELGGYSEERPYSQDYELWLRLAEVGRIVIMPDVILKHRQHAASISSNYDEAQRQYSLINSGGAIVRLLAEELSFTDVAELRAFWLSPLPNIRAAARLNRRLRSILRAFLRNQAPRGSIDRNLAGELSRLIGRHFLSWAHVMGLKRKPVSMLQVLAYASNWYLSSFLHYKIRG